MSATTNKVAYFETARYKGDNMLRIQSIDLLRGLIMIIMAIDHVRVYSGLPAGGPTTGIFFTRWITHYCAPGFAFFAGTSAFLFFMKTSDIGSLRKFLITRGLLLVVFELTIIRFSWMFNFNYSDFAFTGVIWMLGWCMVLFAAFVRLKPMTLTFIGVAIILGQQAFYYVPFIFPESIRSYIEYVWQVFYPVASTGGGAVLSANVGLSEFLGLKVFYVLIPWIGVIMAGYGFGQVLLIDPPRRNRICMRMGLIIIGLFVAVGSVVALSSSSDLPFLFKLLGQQKYPPTQLYIMMTLGPLIALVPWAEKVKGKIAEAIVVIGRVPMFYYLLHIPLIHLAAFVVNIILFGAIHQDWYERAPFVTVPEDQRWGLPLLYITWAVLVLVLYIACRWYAAYKFVHPEKKWLQFI
ncbi:DUF1624 domain-containing protein [soil metagenome]